MAATIAQLRLLLNDPSGASEILSDADYTEIIAIEGDNVYRAAALGADTISATLALKVSTDTGPVKLENQQKFEHYQTLSDTYNKYASAGRGNSDPASGGKMGLPILTGQSVDDIQSNREDTDRYQESFYRGLNDNPKGCIDTDGDCH